MIYIVIGCIICWCISVHLAYKMGAKSAKLESLLEVKEETLEKIVRANAAADSAVKQYRVHNKK